MHSCNDPSQTQNKRTSGQPKDCGVLMFATKPKLLVQAQPMHAVMRGKDFCVWFTHQVVRYCGDCCVKYKPNAGLDPQDID